MAGGRKRPGSVSVQLRDNTHAHQRTTSYGLPSSECSHPMKSGGFVLSAREDDGRRIRRSM